MKETVTVNIGSEAFTLDDDACRTLRCYLDDIRSRLPEDDTETMGDIERRIAEIFREGVSSPLRVITLDVVRATLNQMGTPAAFGEPRRDAAAGAPENGDPAPKEDETPSPRKLYRSRTERSIAGVCGGLGEYFDADPTMIRLVTLLLILFGGLSSGSSFPNNRHANSRSTTKNDTTLATNDNRRLFRSQDSIIAGVCAGLAEFFGLDVSLVRIATLILILFGGLSLWVYIILWLIVPKAPKRLNP